MVVTLDRQLWNDPENRMTWQGCLPGSSRTSVKAQAPKPLKMFLARNERETDSPLWFVALYWKASVPCGVWIWEVGMPRSVRTRRIRKAFGGGL